jgi:hypothetical protein
LAAKHGITADEVDALASKLLVATAGSDAGYQREVSNILFGLAASLPNNPRQIKRIINAFAIYETVGRLYFNYQITSDDKDGQRARRWRQLAMWTTLATEWPQTWRALAREPRFVEAAYSENAATRKAVRKSLLSQLPNEEAKNAAESLLGRLTNEMSLSRLLCMEQGNDAQGSEAGKRDGDAGMFANIRMDADAIYEFNRIMWEPGFPTMGQSMDDPPAH